MTTKSKPKYYRFKYFDPLAGDGPDSLSFEAQRIIDRARFLLTNRTMADIHAGLALLNWLFDDSVSKRHLQLLEDEARKEDEATETEAKRGKPAEENPSVLAPSIIHHEIASDVFSLLSCRDGIDLTGYKDFPNATWPEVFAILSLACIDKACEDEALYSERTRSSASDDMDFERLYGHVSFWLIEAMEALVVGEVMVHEDTAVNKTREETTQAHKKKRSLEAQRAAIKRHAKNNALYEEFAEFYEIGSFKSVRNAAQIFCERYTKKVEHLAQYNRVRTLCDGFSKVSASRSALHSSALAVKG
jgi:hypothetical protein